jgi:hypothetical protein
MPHSRQRQVMSFWNHLFAGNSFQVTSNQGKSKQNLTSREALAYAVVRRQGALRRGTRGLQTDQCADFYEQADKLRLINGRNPERQSSRRLWLFVTRYRKRDPMWCCADLDCLQLTVGLCVAKLVSAPEIRDFRAALEFIRETLYSVRPELTSR